VGDGCMVARSSCDPMILEGHSISEPVSTGVLAVAWMQWSEVQGVQLGAIRTDPVEPIRSGEF